ncbi:MAG: GAF domain-containing sensor histidine kinase [Armatimonadetes bacterium]|nr:GAF domain-containing sensor histidine kinase [Armatimonadota bacterium]
MAHVARFLDAVHMAASKLASTRDTKTVLREVLSICVEAVGAMGGTIYIHDPGNKTLRFLHVLPEEVEKRLERLDIPDEYGVAGDSFQAGRTIISEYGEDGDPHRRAISRRTGITVNTMITVPLQIEGQKPIGIVQLVNKKDGPFDDTDSAVLDTISDIATLAIINSRMLERSTHVAALEGMGRAAHDLANKAGVLVTFLPDFERNIEGLRRALKASDGVSAEAQFFLDMLEGTFDDVFSPYADRIYRYARLINDLAAGKPLVPKKKKGDFASVVLEAVQYMENLARRNYVKIEYDLQRDAPEFEFDDLYVIRIAENLVGNAIKAVRETIPAEWVAENLSKEDAKYAKVLVKYRHTAGSHILQVIDDGPGLSPAQIRQILSGTARSSWEQNSGSGLGTKVIMDLAQTHDATVSIRSRLGEGATFEIVFPCSNCPELVSSSVKREDA